MTRDAVKVMKGVRSAGAVFAGAWTPESAGDFVAGPSHVLPTGGAADMFNGLTPDDFRRRHSFVAFSRADLMETRSTIEKFAEVEGLDAHGRAATIRFDDSV
jgi:histidinol dehydrogenase